MNKIITCMVFLLFILPPASAQPTSRKLDKLIDQLDYQLRYLVEGADSNTDSVKNIPRSFSEAEGYKMVGPGDWTCGFSAGTFWYMFELTGDQYWKSEATKYTDKLDKIQFYQGTHDLGFMAGCSYGNGYRITKNPVYKEALLNTAETLCNRYNPRIGCIRSWNWGEWQFPVIIDNIMNLELLFLASDLSGDPKFREIAISHADKTLENHFRDDMSCFHVVDYDTITGKAIAHQTSQGYKDDSSWARGQSWGLYGFTMCYRETRDIKYLEAARKIFKYIKANLPKDYIPYWDYHAPNIPNEEKDASAAAIVASACYELCVLDSQDYKCYKNLADKIMASLGSKNYRVSDGSNGGFLLMHSVGSKPHNMEVDVPLNYADYYYIEALTRLLSLKR